MLLYKTLAFTINGKIQKKNRVKTVDYIIKKRGTVTGNPLRWGEPLKITPEDN